MASTLPLIKSLKIECRRDGAISFAKVEVVVDGYPVTHNFYSRVGEEAILIDDAAMTITVSDKEAATAARVGERQRNDRAQAEADLQAKLVAVLGKVDAALDAKGASPEAREAIHTLYRANPHYAVSGSNTDFRLDLSKLLRVHGLN